MPKKLREWGLKVTFDPFTFLSHHFIGVVRTTFLSVNISVLFHNGNCPLLLGVLALILPYLSNVEHFQIEQKLLRSLKLFAINLIKKVSIAKKGIY